MRDSEYTGQTAERSHVNEDGMEKSTVDTIQSRRALNKVQEGKHDGEDSSQMKISRSLRNKNTATTCRVNDHFRICKAAAR